MVVDAASKNMSYSLLDKRDPRNMIKACPNCGEIWVKVEGCNGSTTCGSRVSDNVTEKGKFFCKFVFNFAKGKLSWTKKL
jgi:hypothetical protein